MALPTFAARPRAVVFRRSTLRPGADTDQVAGELHIGQGDVSKLERRTDMYVSTLASSCKPSVRILRFARSFPDGSAVKITQFSE